MKHILAQHGEGVEVIDALVEQLDRFLGEARAQPDDVTLLALARLPSQPPGGLLLPVEAESPAGLDESRG